MMHEDKFKTAPVTEGYRKGYERIFGKRVERRSETKAETERRELNSKAHHAQEAADGKKDAQWYMDHEQRVSQDPNFKPRNRPFTKEYSAGHERIFGEK